MLKKIIIKFTLILAVKLDNFIYRVITKLAIIDNNGVHPKHEILRYGDFFLKNIVAGDRVLDVGCAKGEVAFLVSNVAKEVVGIDINSEKIIQAKKSRIKNNIEYVVGDVTLYNFNGKFDKIILSNVLEHIDKRIEFLTKLHNLGNTILLRVPMLDRDWLSVYKKNKGFEYRLDRTHYIEYTIKSITNESELSDWYLEKYSVQFGELWGILKENNH